MIAESGRITVPATVASVAAEPLKYLNKEITLDGIVENAGANLQVRSGRRIVLSDHKGNMLDVVLPAPVEIFQGKGGTQPRMQSAGALLGKNVTVRGKMQTDKDGSPVLVIERVTTHLSPEK